MYQPLRYVLPLAAPPEVPPGLELYDDIEETYLYGSTQELFYRRDPGPNGHTEWQYSWDAREWWPTDQLSPPVRRADDIILLLYIACICLGTTACNVSFLAEPSPSHAP
jgi:hypothetical protein